MAGALPSPALGACIVQAESTPAGTSLVSNGMAAFNAASASVASPAVQGTAKTVSLRSAAVTKALQLATPPPMWSCDVNVGVPADISRMLAMSNILYAHRAVEESPNNVSISRDVQQLERSFLESHWDRVAEDIGAEEDDNVKSSRNIVVRKTTSARQRRAKARSLDSSENHPENFNIDSAVKGTGEVSVKDSPSDCVATFLTEIGKAKLLTKDEEIGLARTLQVSVALKAARERLSEKLGREVSHAEWAREQGCSVRALRKKLREGDLARHKLVSTNLRLVVSVAKKYNRNGVDLSDLITAGTIGLTRGLEKFDPSRGYKLSTYVHWWIRQAVSRAVVDYSRTVRLPSHVHETLTRVKKAKSRLASEGEDASAEKLASLLGMSEKKVNGILKLKYKTKSMNEPIMYLAKAEEGSTLDNFIADPEGESRPWEDLESQLLEGNVKRLLLDHLDPRERDIIKHRYGFGRTDGYCMTLDLISHRHGVSRERIRQVEMVAVRKLKALSKDTELQRYCY